jgi:tetratricopeptide (TPR) repeat protein
MQTVQRPKTEERGAAMKLLNTLRLDCLLLCVGSIWFLPTAALAQNAAADSTDFGLFGRVYELDAKAGALIQKGDYRAAKAPAEEVVRIRRRIVGDDRFETALGLGQLGLIEMKLADYAGARACYEQAFAIYKKFWGEQNNYAIDALDHMGAANLALKDYAAARSCYEKVCAVYATYGEDDPQKAAAVKNLNRVLRLIGGDALVESERAKRAQRRNTPIVSDDKILTDALVDSYLRHLPAGSYQVGGTQISDKPELSTRTYGVSSRNRQYQKALGDTEKVLEGRRQMFGLNHRDTALAFSRLGFLHAKLGNYAEAKSCYEQAVAINTQVSGNESPDTLAAVNNLNHVLQFIADSNAGEAFRRKPASIHQTDIDPSQKTMIDTLRRSHERLEQRSSPGEP